MPREQVEWYVEKSLHDDNKLHAKQSCNYYSIVNIDKGNYPYISSYEQEQTWTLTRTMSHNNKRYQSSIENIHLTMPPILTILKPYTLEKDKIKLDRSISLLPPIPPSKQYRLNKINIPQTLYSNEKKISHANSMRIMQLNGEFVVRI